MFLPEQKSKKDNLKKISLADIESYSHFETAITYLEKRFLLYAFQILVFQTSRQLRGANGVLNSFFFNFK
ncbi:unnamed protein product [Caenorhabditis brenneri]